MIDKNKTIAVLGGGQLGKMIADSAFNMGFKSIVLDPSEDACAKLSNDTIHLAHDYTNEEALKYICDNSRVITYEFENVESKAIDLIEKYDGNIPQGKKPLYLSQHRIREKEAVNKLGVKTPNFIKIESKDELKNAFNQINLPAILKTCMGGYDGKGQWVIKSEKDIDDIDITNGEYVLEEMIIFDKEVSCMAIRSLKGETITFPVSENIHKNGILHLSIVPARIDYQLEKRVKEIAIKIIEGLDIVGSLAIEFFIEKENIYFNEMAPRPHNSMHYTIDACDYSQFDLHLKSILNTALPSPKLTSPVVMLNILGDDKIKLQKKMRFIEKDDKIKLHIYGKTEWKHSRKMGHINFLGEDLDDIILKASTFLGE